MRLAALILCALVPAAAAGEADLPAPYQVEGLVQYRDDHHRLGDGMGLADRLVAVTLGRAEGVPPPVDAAPGEVTVIGSAGLGQGRLYEVRRVCEFLCGDEGEECHYEALYALDRPLAGIGTPLAVLPRGAGVSAMAPVGATGDAPAKVASGGPPAALAWSPEGDAGPRLRLTRWEPGQGALGLEVQWPGSEVYPVEAAGCRAEGAGELVELHCDGVALILADGAPLLFSWPDYNLPSADAVARLQVGGTAAYLVRLGLKAQTVFGLLHRDGGGWQGRFRPRDYALLC